MKNSIYFLVVLVVFGFMILTALKVKDNLNSKQKTECEILKDSIQILLKRPVMTSDQFLQLYKYDEIHHYYILCVKNPKNWKYYKGWSNTVFKGK